MSDPLPDQSPPPDQNSPPDKTVDYGQPVYRRRRKRFFGLFARAKKPVEPAFVAPKSPEIPAPDDAVGYSPPALRRRKKRFLWLFSILKAPLVLGPSPDVATFFSRRWRRFVKLFSTPKGPEGFYSAFLPLLIVFCSFIVLLLYGVSNLRYRTLVLSKQNARLAQAVKRADAQTAFIDGLHKDLQTLAPTHPAASLILREFFPDIPPNAGSSPNPPPQ